MKYDAAVPPELLGAAMAVLVAALPPPPETVVRVTKSFGTVTLDHKAHLARRVPCQSCHGPGPVRKIVFTPRSAHAACRNCHVEKGRGPVDCRACHVVPPSEASPPAAEGAQAGVPTGAAATGATAVAMGPSGASPGVSSGPVAKGDATGVMAGVQIPETSATSPGFDPRGRLLFPRTAEFGVLGLTGQGQDLVFGPSFQLTGRSGHSVVEYSVAFAGGTGSGRTQFLIGGGGGFKLSPRVRATAVAVCGMDATYAPVSILPGIGLRAGLELLNDDSPWSLRLSATGLADVLQGDSAGGRSGGGTFSIGFAAGYRLDRLAQ